MGELETGRELETGEWRRDEWGADGSGWGGEGGAGGAAGNPGEQDHTREQVCNLQQLYQDLLGRLGLREEAVPPGPAEAARGAAVMNSLGALSRAVDEYDLLHFRQVPAHKLADFADWLQGEAPLFYEDAAEGAPRAAAPAEADAVTVCTVHRAKGQEWPAVFVPGLAEGRFPHSGRTRGRTRWHLLPRGAVRDAARYDTTRAEETRLMYVALTRAKKFLCCTFAPDPALSQPQQPSSFLTAFARCPDVRTVGAGQAPPSPEEEERSEEREKAKLPPRARVQERALVLTFSQVGAYLRCPYLFKLRTLYGWAAAPSEAEGFGKGSHDALAEVHAAAIAGRAPGCNPAELARALTARHLLLPYAGAEGALALAEAAAGQLAAYLTNEGERIAGVTHAEAPFEVVLEDAPGDGETAGMGGTLTIVGRNDVIWGGAGEETLREVKSRREVQSEAVSRAQLYVEALGFLAATGRQVRHLEVYNLAGGDEGAAGVQFREAFDPAACAAVEGRLREAGRAMRHRALPRLPVYGPTCRHCDHCGLCRDRPGKAIHTE